MRFGIAVAALIFASSLAPSGATLRADTPTVASDLEAGFGGWGGWRSAYNYWYIDYASYVANYRINAYQAAYEDATLRGVRAESNYYAALYDQAYVDLTRLQRQQRNLNSMIEIVEQYGRALDDLVAAQVTPDVNNAFRYFIGVVPDIAAFGGTEVPLIPASEFVARQPYILHYDSTIHDWVEIPNIVVDFPGGNYLQFIQWLRDHPVDPVTGSGAHFLLLQIRADLAAAGTEWLHRLQNSRDTIFNTAGAVWAAISGGPGGADLPSRPPVPGPTPTPDPEPNPGP